MEGDVLVQRGVITNWWEWWRNVAHLGFLLFPLLSNVSPSHTTSHQHYFKTFLALPKQLYRWTCHWLTDWLSLLNKKLMTFVQSDAMTNSTIIDIANDNNIDNDKTKTKRKTFRKHYQRVTSPKDTCDLWDIWSEWQKRQRHYRRVILETWDHIETLLRFLTIEINNLNIHSDSQLWVARDSISNSCNVYLEPWHLQNNRT